MIRLRTTLQLIANLQPANKQSRQNLSTLPGSDMIISDYIILFQNDQSDGKMFSLQCLCSTQISREHK
jgi:hypothetical protein